MLTHITTYLPIPRRFPVIGRCLAMCLYIAAPALLLLLFARVFLAMRGSHSHWLNPELHFPMSPDFISYHPSRSDHPRRLRED